MKDLFGVEREACFTQSASPSVEFVVSDRRIPGYVIHVWKPDEDFESKGKMTFHYAAGEVFGFHRGATRVALVQVNRIPLFLAEVGGSWFDCQRREIRIVRRKA